MAETIARPGSHAPICSPNIRHPCRRDLGGAGQITIDGNYAYLGYMYGPEGTSILDISDTESTDTTPLRPTNREGLILS